MKRGLLGLSLLVLLTQIVSAQFYSGYGRFSITDFFSSIDPTTIIFGLLFLIFFALIFYALSRIFKDPYGQPNKGIAGVMAFAVTSLIIYGLYRTGFNFEGIFFDLGLSVDSLYPILAVLFLIVAVLIIWKLKVSGFLMIFGLFILLLTIFTDIFYEKGIALLIGFVSLVVGLMLWRRGRRIMRGVGRGAWGAGRGVGRGAKWVSSKYDWEKEKRQARAIGRGITWGGRKTKEIAQKEWQKEKDVMQARKFRRAQRGAYREDARRQKEMERQKAAQGRRQQAQEQIQQINNEISRLQQMIPSASVIERGKIEDQIRALEKRARKLGKFL